MPATLDAGGALQRSMGRGGEQGLRLAVYTDYTYHRSGIAVYAERAFAIFLAGLRPALERLVVLGRFSPPGGNARYPLGDVDFVELPFYPRLSQPVRAAPALLRSVRPFWHPRLGKAVIVRPTVE